MNNDSSSTIRLNTIIVYSKVADIVVIILLVIFFISFLVFDYSLDSICGTCIRSLSEVSDLR